MMLKAKVCSLFAMIGVLAGCPQTPAPVPTPTPTPALPVVEVGVVASPASPRVDQTFLLSASVEIKQAQGLEFQWFVLDGAERAVSFETPDEANTFAVVEFSGTVEIGCRVTTPSGLVGTGSVTVTPRSTSGGEEPCPPPSPTTD